jgi:TetR/AcrR family transcriptional repressor of bet genes
MAAGSISQYFRSKDRLFTAVLRQLSEEFESHWQRRLAESGDDAAAQLLGFVQCYFDPQLCQREKVAVWFAFWGEVQARPRYQAVCAAFDRRHDAALERLCGRLVAAGAAGRALTAREAARTVAALCQGLWLEFLTGADRPSREALGRLASRGLAALFPGAAGAFATGAGGKPAPRRQRQGRVSR